MRNIAEEFLNSQQRSQIKSLSQKKYDISIYVRYGHQVDYPEIAEAVIVFIQEYIRRYPSSCWGNIRIVPREVDKKPHEELF